VSGVYWKLDVSATGRSLVHRSPTECGVSEYDLEASTMRSPRNSRAVGAWEKKLQVKYVPLYL
jgi:hypothetical protein